MELFLPLLSEGLIFSEKMCKACAARGLKCCSKLDRWASHLVSERQERKARCLGIEQRQLSSFYADGKTKRHLKSTPWYLHGSFLLEVYIVAIKL